jgi:putative DNA primase/helicase
MTDLRSIATALGGTVVGRQVMCPGPGHSPRDRSLSVTISASNEDGFVAYSHAGDDWRSCRDHVLARLGRGARRAYRRDQPLAIFKERSLSPVVDDRSVKAVALWEAATEPRFSIVEDYLWGRGLTLPDDLANRVVRFHPACPWRDEDGSLLRRPAMLTAFRSIADDRLVAVHRTLLSPEGQKLGRRMLGPVGGAAIKIDGDECVEQGLTICEGFETGLAGRELGFRPVWALGSAGAIGTFPVLPGIDAVTILAETDDSGANAKAIRQCGNRWAADDREVIVAAPRVAGDMNDALRST